MFELETFGEIIMFDGNFVKSELSDLKEDFKIVSNEGINYLLFEGRKLMYSSKSGGIISNGVHHFDELPGSLKLEAISLLAISYKELCGSLLISDLKRTVSDGSLLVSIIDNKVVGVLSFVKNDHNNEQISNIFIKMFYVDSDLKGKGIGKNIMKELESFSKKEGINDLTLTSESKFDYEVYEKMGYEMLYSFDSETSTNMVFRKSLLPDFKPVRNRLGFLTEDFMNYMILEDLYYGSSDPLSKLFELNKVPEYI